MRQKLLGKFELLEIRNSKFNDVYELNSSLNERFVLMKAEQCKQRAPINSITFKDLL